MVPLDLPQLCFWSPPKGHPIGWSEDPAPGDQVDDQDDHGNDEKEVNQAACDVEAEAKNPQNEQDYKDSPEHSRSPCSDWRRSGQVRTPAPVWVGCRFPDWTEVGARNLRRLPNPVRLTCSCG